MKQTPKHDLKTLQTSLGFLDWRFWMFFDLKTLQASLGLWTFWMSLRIKKVLLSEHPLVRDDVSQLAAAMSAQRSRFDLLRGAAGGGGWSFRGVFWVVVWGCFLLGFCCFFWVGVKNQGKIDFLLVWLEWKTRGKGLGKAIVYSFFSWVENGKTIFFCALVFSFLGVGGE